VSLRGRTLHRVFTAARSTPWWFASLPQPVTDPEAHGRFDLPVPLGSCYLALTPVAAVLETLVHFTGRLPDVELRSRRRAEVLAPDSAPVAANLAAPSSRGAGVTAALWAGGDRRLTQSWALALHRAGWRALHSGISHDPAGRLRAVTLFDAAGEHAPYDSPSEWPAQLRTLHDDEVLHRQLARYGIEVARSDVQLPVVPLENSGLMPAPTRGSRAAGTKTGDSGPDRGGR
jgi:hypothetical protein